MSAMLDIISTTKSDRAIINVRNIDWKVASLLGWSHSPKPESKPEENFRLDTFWDAFPNIKRDIGTSYGLANNFGGRNITIVLDEKAYIFGNEQMLKVQSTAGAPEKSITIRRADSEVKDIRTCLKVTEVSEDEYIRLRDSCLAKRK